MFLRPERELMGRPSRREFCLEATVISEDVANVEGIQVPRSSQVWNLEQRKRAPVPREPSVRAVSIWWGLYTVLEI